MLFTSLMQVIEADSAVEAVLQETARAQIAEERIKAAGELIAAHFKVYQNALICRGWKDENNEDELLRQEAHKRMYGCCDDKYCDDKLQRRLAQAKQQFRKMQILYHESNAEALASQSIHVTLPVG